MRWSAGWIGGGLLPDTSAARRRWGLAASTALVVLTVLGGASMWLSPPNAGSPSSDFSLALPGGNVRASQRHDPYGTLAIDAAGPMTPTLLWSYQLAGGFTGGPAVGPDGTL
jgi:hypothetical protein